jgi:hypothetical protein
MNWSFGRIVLIGTALLHVCGCSCFVPWRQDLTVEVAQADAKGRLNGVGVKTAPATFSVRRDKTYTGYVTKPGYKSESFIVSNTMNACGILDAIGFCAILLPGIGLAFPGAFSLENDTYYFDLQPASPEQKAGE